MARRTALLEECDPTGSLCPRGRGVQNQRAYEGAYEKWAGLKAGPPITCFHNRD
jgi:hypothetical protein